MSREFACRFVQSSNPILGPAVMFGRQHHQRHLRHLDCKTLELLVAYLLVTSEDCPPRPPSFSEPYFILLTWLEVLAMKVGTETLSPQSCEEFLRRDRFVQQERRERPPKLPPLLPTRLLARPFSGPRRSRAQVHLPDVFLPALLRECRCHPTLADQTRQEGRSPRPWKAEEH
jgi:hypothetical protein